MGAAIETLTLAVYSRCINASPSIAVTTHSWWLDLGGALGTDEQIRDGFENAMATTLNGYSQLLHDDAHIYRGVVNFHGGTRAGVECTFNRDGGNSGVLLPAQVAAVVSLRADARKRHGRTFWPWQAESSIGDTASTWSAEWLGAMRTNTQLWYTTVQDTLSTELSVSEADIHPCVYSKTDDESHLIVGLRADEMVGTQRRRLTSP